jgi:hypothetical protein
MPDVCAVMDGFEKYDWNREEWEKAENWQFIGWFWIS